MIRRSNTLIGLVGIAGLSIIPIADGQTIANPDFVSGLTGWTASHFGGSTAPGAVSALNGQATLAEGDSFLVTLEQTFTVPANPDLLAFDLSLIPGFDLGDAFIPDAFEVSLLDANNASVVPTWRPGATSFFNLEEDGTPHPGSATTFNGTTVSVDISGVPEGTAVTLFFDLIGGDSDTGSGVSIGNIVLAQEPDGGDNNDGGGNPGPGNRPPTCDLNGPLDIECNGNITTVSLEDATLADSDADVLNVAWTTDCPSATFDDPAVEKPTLSVASSPGCSIECNVTVTLDDGRSAPVVCTTPLTISDTTAPTLQCASDVSIACDDSRMPANTGQSSASDVCDLQPAVTFMDRLVDADQGGISRVWSARDACGNSASCTQRIALTDDVPPTITCPENVDLQTTNANGMAVSDVPLSASVTDNCVGEVVVTDDRPEEVFAPGETVVVFTATDVGGNVATCTVMVRITVTEEPAGQVVPGQGSQEERVTTTTTTSGPFCGAIGFIPLLMIGVSISLLRVRRGLLGKVGSGRGGAAAPSSKNRKY